MAIHYSNVLAAFKIIMEVYLLLDIITGYLGSSENKIVSRYGSITVLTANVFFYHDVKQSIKCVPQLLSLQSSWMLGDGGVGRNEESYENL